MKIQLYILKFSALRALNEKSFYFLIEKVIDELLTTTFQAHLLGLLGKTGFSEIRTKIRKRLTNFCEYFEFGAVRRCANLIELEKY